MRGRTSDVIDHVGRMLVPGSSLAIAALVSAYRSSSLTPREVLGDVTRRIDERGDDHVWITRVGQDDLLARIDELEALQRSETAPRLPLWGVPFAVKDNIDVAGLPTTAGCPGFAYTPTVSAPAVQRLVDAGAVVVGKTNLDQFATGLTGSRSPYGACESVFGNGLISGGSSSGSAVAVAAGLVSFSLGTDTAGSGRVPAALNGIFGLKPTRGRIPTTGVVPACASLDCVSVFATTVADASTVLAICADPGPPARIRRSSTVRIGIGAGPQLDFFGDGAMRSAWDEAARSYADLAERIVEVDVAPLVEAGELLYGPWVAERLAGLEHFVATNPDQLLPITRSILEQGRDWSAVDVFAAMHRLAELQGWARRLWQEIDVLLLPTIPTTFTLSEVAVAPLERNRLLGRYTQFANLLDTAALTVPAGMTSDGRPASVTLVGPAHSDDVLAAVARRSMGHPEPIAERSDVTLIAVAGRHLSGEAASGELADHGATLVETTVTAPVYRFYRIGHGDAAVPGLVRSDGMGSSIEVELWAIPSARMGAFLGRTAPPLGLGWVELIDGRSVIGFLCEAYAAAGAVDITASGGWRAHRRSTATRPPTEEGS